MTDNETNRAEDIPDSSRQPEERPEAVAPAPKPGAQLAEYRRKAGLSVEHVVSRMKMTARQVQNLESDNYDALHGIPLARAFVRAYAKFLQVDPEPLVAMFPSDKTTVKTVAKATGPAKRSIPSGPFAGNREPFKSRRGISGKMIGLLLVILLVVAAIVSQQMGLLPVNFSFMQKSAKQKDDVSKETSSDRSQSKAAIEEKTSISGSVSTEVVAPKTIMSEDAPAADKNKPEPAPVAAPAKPEAAPATPVSATPAVSEKTDVAPKSIPAQSGNSLVMRFRENSWMQIQRSDSTVLFKRLVKAGEVENFDVKEPVVVTIGYAPGVDVTLRGKPLELKQSENSTVVRLKLK